MQVGPPERRDSGQPGRYQPDPVLGGCRPAVLHHDQHQQHGARQSGETNPDRLATLHQPPESQANQRSRDKTDHRLRRGMSMEFPAGIGNSRAHEETRHHPEGCRQRRAIGSQQPHCGRPNQRSQGGMPAQSGEIEPGATDTPHEKRQLGRQHQSAGGAPEQCPPHCQPARATRERQRQADHDCYRDHQAAISQHADRAPRNPSRTERRQERTHRSVPTQARPALACDNT